MIVPSNPPTAPASPTPHAPTLRPAAGRGAAADKPRHIAYIKDIQSYHAPPAQVSPSLIVPSFLRTPSRIVHDAAVPPRPDEYHAAIASGETSPDPAYPTARRGSSPPAEPEMSLRMPRYLDRMLDPHADSDGMMTTERGSSTPASLISSLALPRPIAALQALSDGPRLDLTAVHANPTDALFAPDEGGDEVDRVVPPVQSSLLAVRKPSQAARIPSSSTGAPRANAIRPAKDMLKWTALDQDIADDGEDDAQAPEHPSPEFNWARTLPHSLQGLRSLGTSTVRPPLRPDQLGIAGVPIRPGVGGLTPARTAGAAGEDDRSVGGNSTARHLAEYKQILHKLGTELSVGSATVRACRMRAPMGEDGSIRIGEAVMSRMGPPAGLRDGPGRRASGLCLRMLVGEADDECPDAARMDVDELNVEWCWFCHCEFPRVDMALQHLGGDGDQWVCQGCAR